MKLSVTPEMQAPIQAAGGGPAAVSQSLEGWRGGLTHDVAPCCLEIHFSSLLLGLHSPWFSFSVYNRFSLTVNPGIQSSHFTASSSLTQ